MKPLLRLPLITAACLIASSAPARRWPPTTDGSSSVAAARPTGSACPAAPTARACPPAGPSTMAASPAWRPHADRQRLHPAQHRHGRDPGELCAAAARVFIQRFASLLSMAGSTSFAAGLDMARGSPHDPDAGRGAGRRGHRHHAARPHRAKRRRAAGDRNGHRPSGGSWDLSAGTAYAGTLKLQSTAAASGFKQTGARSRRAASISPAWLGTAPASSRPLARRRSTSSKSAAPTPAWARRPPALWSLSGPGSLLNGTGSFIIGSAGSKP